MPKKKTKKIVNCTAPIQEKLAEVAPEAPNYSDFYQDYLKVFRAASGDVHDTKPMVFLLYRLLRDGIVKVGDIESWVIELEYHKKCNEVMGTVDTSYTNGYIAQYAQFLTKRIEDILK